MLEVSFFILYNEVGEEIGEEAVGCTKRKAF